MGNDTAALVDEIYRVLRRCEEALEDLNDYAVELEARVAAIEEARREAVIA